MLYHVESSPKAPDAEQWVKRGWGGEYLLEEEKEEEEEEEEKGEEKKDSSPYSELAVGGA